MQTAWAQENGIRLGVGEAMGGGGSVRMRWMDGRWREEVEVGAIDCRLLLAKSTMNFEHGRTSRNAWSGLKWSGV